MHRRRRDGRARLVCVAALALLTLPAVAPGAEPTATPSGIEGMPGAGREDVLRALRKVHHKYGEHAVQIQTQLLVNAMRNGSLRATAVRVDGVKPYRDKRYLGFDVETGLVFDTTTRDEPTRIAMLWTTILIPTLERLTELRLPADGIRVALHYHHRPYQSLAELRASIDEPGTPEETDFYVLAPDVSDLVYHRLTAHTLIARTQVTVDGGERVIAALVSDVPTAPGPD